MAHSGISADIVDVRLRSFVSFNDTELRFKRTLFNGLRFTTVDPPIFASQAQAQLTYSLDLLFYAQNCY